MPVERADIPDGLNAECWDQICTGVLLRNVMSAVAFEALLQVCREHLLKDSSPEVDF